MAVQKQSDNTPKPFDGDSQFTRGMNSQQDPISLPQGFYRSSMNTVNRGGLPQCRPGYSWKFNMPDGRIQGSILFAPTDSVEFLVFAVAGRVYVSEYPYANYRLLENISFRDDSDSVYFCSAEKAVSVQDDGSIKLITPFKVLIMQDGFTAPAVWDGSTNKHLTGDNVTVLGTAMAWSGGRLWVARRQELFSSDINDPLSFIEDDYISNARSFLLDKPIIALAEVTAKAQVQLLAFTETSTTAFQSSIRKRTLWESTPDFQQTIFPNLGCVSHRSICTQYGLLWWYSRFGMTNLNSAASTYLSSEFRYVDSEMAGSKAYIHSDLSKISCAAHENYLLVSVPYADVFNAHTWVLDKSPAENINADSPDAWNSYWTGTRPAEWVTGPIQGLNRIFQFSRDYDGHNRCWEAFSTERTDNGCAITWSLETRAYTGGNMQEKDFRFVEILMAELEGTVDLAVFWSGGSKGAYKRCLSKRIQANVGSIIPDTEYENDTQFFSLKKQYRKITSSDVKNSPVESTSCQIESSTAERTDLGFQILVVGSGPGAIRGIRVFTSNESPDTRAGSCEEDELEAHFVRYDGTGSNSLEDLAGNPVEFSAESSEEVEYSGEVFSGEGSAVSIISEDDAEKVADCHANNQALIWQASVLPAHEGANLDE
jgi:hypothetical protein